MATMSKPNMMSDQHGGHLYLQTNEVRNMIVHYSRAANGAISEMAHPHGRRRFR